MKIEVKSLKKTQIEIKLKMKSPGCQTKISEVNLTNRLKDVEERISGLEEKVEEINSSVKENMIQK